MGAKCKTQMYVPAPIDCWITVLNKRLRKLEKNVFRFFRTQSFLSKNQGENVKGYFVFKPKKFNLSPDKW